MAILISGATGNIGGAVVQQLLQQPSQQPLRALVRDPDKATQLAAQAVELARGDFSQPASLEAALQGVERAFLVMPNHPDQVALEGNFVTAAQRAGVRHLVKLSVLRAGELPSTFQQWHRQIEAQIEASGMAWTHLRPNMLMQNMRWFTPTMAQQGAFYHSIGDTLVSHVDGADVAAVAALCLSQPGHENQTYDLTGAEAISFSQVAAYFSQALGRPIQYIPVSPADLKAARLANGEPAWYLDAEAELFAAWQAGAGTAIDPTLSQLLGRAPARFADYAQTYVQTHPEEFLTPAGA